PYVAPEIAAELGVELVGLETLLRSADFVTICCALTPETRHLNNEERLALIKPSAYLVNMGRGPIVDQRALAETLRQRRIQGAGIDVFEEEPPDPADPLLALDNVILSPHALCWTDECFTGMGRAACQGIVDVASGAIPPNVVNPAVLESDRFLAKLGRHTRRTAS
ncbi:MAG: NAD(P)-dependent oxidoreductase, partial [Candidatus Dormiibacterota bacterium]